MRKRKIGMYIKNFDNWIEIKKEINKDKKLGNFRVGEIRWAAIGVNIGSEIDGKGSEYYEEINFLKGIWLAIRLQKYPKFMKMRHDMLKAILDK